MTVATLAGLTLALSYLSHWLGQHLVQIAPYFLFRLLLLPGIIVHESAHVVGCILMGAQVKHIHFWTQQGGEVLHTPPKVPLIGQPIISFAPLLAGLIALVALSQAVTAEPITLSWDRALYAFLMLSIGATLMPSKQDWANSWLSALFLTILATAVFVTWPQAWEYANRALRPIVQPFLIVTISLALLVALTKLFTLRR